MGCRLVAQIPKGWVDGELAKFGMIKPVGGRPGGKRMLPMQLSVERAVFVSREILARGGPSCHSELRVAAPCYVGRCSSRSEAADPEFGGDATPPSTLASVGGAFRERSGPSQLGVGSLCVHPVPFSCGWGGIGASRLAGVACGRKFGRAVGHPAVAYK